MTEDRWEAHGDLLMAVSAFDKNNSSHKLLAEEVICATVQTVAQVHDAGFNEKGFRQNMAALYSGDIRVDFFLAKWDICNAKPICLGAATNWPTIGFDASGNIQRGVHTEDVCLLGKRLRQLITAKPKDKVFPEESLLSIFERISLQQMKAKGEVYKYGEVNPDNSRMMRGMLDNGGVFGRKSESAVLEFGTIPILLSRGLTNLPVIHPQKNLLEDEDLFIVPWQNGDSDIRFIATKAQATAAGKPRVDIRPWHNGVLPDQDTLEFVVASALLAIKNEVELQNWAYQPLNKTASPSIPICGNTSEGYNALFNTCKTNLILPESAPPTFGTLAPAAHVFIINDQQMLDAFYAVGAETRLFGNRPMMPGVNVVGFCESAEVKCL
jgi:hypothetical protein